MANAADNSEVIQAVNGAATPDHITAFPCNETKPNASMLNYAAGQVIANGATVKLDPNGDICVFTGQAMHLIVDITGYLS